MTAKTSRFAAAAILSAFAFVGAPGPPPPAWCQSRGSAPSSKAMKQIRLIENGIDDVLVDSKNLLVGSRSPSHGIYIPEFGVLFSFEAALLSHDDRNWWRDWNWNDFKIETKDGKTIIHIPDDEAEDSSESKNGKKRPRTTEERYEASKAELVEAILEYGGMLTELRDDQWLGIALFFDDEEEIGDREISTVLFRAKMSDLRAHSSDRISDKEMQSRVVIDEY